jgi:ABC-type sugar transport system ATPase subunit
MPMPLVRVEDLRKEFGAVVAVDGVTFDADGGEVVALVGDNEAGKSTVVNCLAGVHPATSGPQCLFCGDPAGAFKPLDQGWSSSVKRLWWCRPCETTWVD